MVIVIVFSIFQQISFPVENTGFVKLHIWLASSSIPKICTSSGFIQWLRSLPDDCTIYQSDPMKFCHRPVSAVQFPIAFQDLQVTKIQ